MAPLKNSLLPKRTTDRNLLSQQDLAAEFDLSPRTLEKWRYTGHGPAYLRVGRHVRYRREAVDAWLAGQEVSVG